MVLVPAGLLLVLTLATLSVMVGSVVIPPDAVAAALLHPTGTELDLIVVGVRIPRTLLAIAVGAALAVAGAVTQALSRNPLAEPGLLGINAGASFAVALGLTVLGITRFADTLWLAFFGAAGASALVAGLAARGRGPQSTARLVLAGVAVTAVLAGATTALSLANPAAYAAIRLWEAGSLAGRNLGVAATTLAVVAGGCTLALALGPRLTLLLLGEDVAHSLGSRVRTVQALGFLTIVVLCGAATAAAGPIAFIGLLVPHAVRALVGPDQTRVLLHSLIGGPAIVLAADLLARTVIAPRELPLGVVTAFLGAPLLVALVLARRRFPG